MIALAFTGIAATMNSCSKEEEGNLTVVTIPVSEITYHSAKSGVEWQGGSDNLVDGGICYSTKPNPTCNDSVFAFDIKNIDTASDLWVFQLTPNTTYRIRAYLIQFTGSSVRTFYGQEIEFTTLAFDKSIQFNPGIDYGSLSDIEGNTYRSVEIGTQVWMAENLRTSRLNDGTSIPKVTYSDPWWDVSTPGYNWCDKDSDNYSTTCGALYNWYTVNTGMLCPAGWHVPSDDEWETLCAFLGGPDQAAHKLKETGSIHWDAPNDGATNESGFTALPDCSGNFCGWWSTTRMNPYDPAPVWFYFIVNNSPYLQRAELFGSTGMNVRCMKD
jgi:uncharacterized protein (TIGR02145 family)